LEYHRCDCQGAPERVFRLSLGSGTRVYPGNRDAHGCVSHLTIAVAVEGLGPSTTGRPRAYAAPCGIVDPFRWTMLPPTRVIATLDFE
jgi:hypothetical protein